MSSRKVVRRQVARVLLFDANQPAWWYLPGGGMRRGESPEQAARRELLEEVGVEIAELGPVVLHLTGVRFRYDGRDFEQDEWHLIGRLPDGQLGRGRAGDIEAAAVAAHRWWSLDELSSSREVPIRHTRGRS